MGHNINPHCVKVLSDKNIIIKHWVKKAMAMKQRKPSLKSGKGLDLRAIYNPLSGLSESFEVDRWVVKVSGQSVKKCQAEWLADTNQVGGDFRRQLATFDNPGIHNSFSVTQSDTSQRWWSSSDSVKILIFCLKFCTEFWNFQYMRLSVSKGFFLSGTLSK